MMATQLQNEVVSPLNFSPEKRTNGRKRTRAKFCPETFILATEQEDLLTTKH